MWRILQIGLAVMLALASSAGTVLAQSRNALVIGNSAYQTVTTLKTPATDAAIVAETLRAAGYNVTELRDIRQADIGQTMRDFLDKVAAGGPEGVAFFYYSGYAAQSEGENFLVPVDAVINSDGDVAGEAFRLNDLTGELAKISLAARIVVLDAARDHKFGAASSKPVAKGLAMGDSVPGMLLAFAAAPGAIAIDGDGEYSLYTGALVTMMREPGLDMEQIFKAVRLQINQTTAGAQTPWMVADLAVDLRLFAAAAAEPTAQTTPTGARIPPKEERDVTKDMIRALSPDDAYAVAVEEDTLEAYQWFVELFPTYPLAPQVWEIIETRREAVLWRRALAQNTTRAYWNYLKRYPDGTHTGEAQERLDVLSAPRAPPVNYVAVPEPLPPDYDDEAVGLVEIVPEGYDAPPSVFEVLVPLFIPRGPRIFIDRPRDRFVPNRIPIVRGDPVRIFINRDRRNIRDGRITRDGRTTRRTGISSGTAITGVRRTGDGGTAIRDGRPGTGRKTGLGLPPTGITTPGARTTTTPATGPGIRGTTGPGTTPGGTPGTRRGGVALPPSGAQPTTRGTPPGTTTLPGRPATPGATPARPTTPTPGGAVTTRPGLPPAPGATPARPTTPTPGGAVTTRPGLPPAPGATPARPTTPTPGGAVTTRPGLPATTGRPATTTTPPTVRPTPPTARPATPPTARPTTPRPTPPVVRPAPPRATPPVVRPAPPRPTPPVVRPAPPRPTPPVVRPAPPRPAPVARPAAPPRPAPVVRPAAPPRPAPAARPAPAPKVPVCKIEKGKKVCR